MVVGKDHWVISCDLDMPIAFDCADESWALCAVKNEDCLGNSLPEGSSPGTFQAASGASRNGYLCQIVLKLKNAVD